MLVSDWEGTIYKRIKVATAWVTTFIRFVDQPGLEPGTSRL